MKYGETFKNLRESRNISLNSLADDQISKATISKFENGQLNISVNRFFHLISEIHVRPTEFLSFARDKQNQQETSLFWQVTQNTLQGNAAQLVVQADNQYRLYQKSQNKFDYLNFIMIAAIKSETEHKKIDQRADLNVLTDYLFSNEQWSNYDLVLYGNTMSQLKLETITVFSNELINRVLSVSKVGNIYETSINILLNTVEICLRQKNVYKAEHFIDLIKNENLSDAFLLEKTKLKQLQGYVLYMQNDQESGKELIEQALKIYQLSDSKFFYENAIDDIHKILGFQM